MASYNVLMADGGGATYTCGGTTTALNKVLNDCRALKELLVPETVTCSTTSFETMIGKIDNMITYLNTVINNLPDYQRDMTNIKIKVKTGSA